MRYAEARSRKIWIAALLAGVIGQLVGCAPDPVPTPTPTPAFSSEEEAFAAAEEVYRAYNDALNEIDPSDPQTFEPLYTLASGDLETADRKNFSVMHAEGHVVRGDVRVVSFNGESSSPLFERVVAVVCLDVSEVEVTDAGGRSLVAPGRPHVYALSVEFVARDDRNLTMDSSLRVGDEKCAG